MDSSTLANQLTAYDANKQNSVDLLNNAMSQYGVPEIRSRVSGLRTTLSNTENALNNVDPSVTGRTQGSLVTEAQRQAQVNNERAPIAQQYSDQQGALSDESANLTDAENSANQLATSQQNDYATGRQALQDEYTAAYTREQDAAKLAEQVREANLTASTASAANTGFNLGNDYATPATPAANPNAAPTLTGGKSLQDAYNAIKSLVGTNNKNLINTTIQAIAKSAGYGNTYDQNKLQLLQQLGYGGNVGVSSQSLGNGNQLSF